MSWPQTVSLIATILVATGLIITVVKMGLSGVNKRVDDVMLQLSEIRKTLMGLAVPMGSNEEKNE